MESFVVDLKPLLDIGLQLLAALLLALGTWAVAWVVRKLKLSADSEVRAYLDQALRNGVALALEQARRRGESLGKVETRSKAVADAANYAIARVPEALKHFGIDDDSLAKMVAARLPPPEWPDASRPAWEKAR